MEKKSACNRVIRVAVVLLMTAFVCGGCMSVKINRAAELGDVGFLIETLKNGKASHIADAKLALIDVGSPAVEPLIAVVKDSSVGWFSRGHAARALGRIGDSRAVEPLIAALTDENSSVRRHAASALGHIGDTVAVEPLISALEDADSNVRLSAVTALGSIGDARAVDPLIFGLKDKKYYVRRNAAIALGEIGNPRAVKPLISALTMKDESMQVRTYVAEALGKIGDARAVQSLITTMKTAKRQLDNAVAKHGSQYGRDPVVTGKIINIWGSTGNLVNAARAGLSHITGEDLGDDAEIWQKWWDKNKGHILENR